MPTFLKRTHLAAPAEVVFRWHARPGAFERLTPPWAPVTVVERSGGIDTGARVVLDIPVGPTRVRWVAEHRNYVEGRRFTDVQVSGPFARWAHTHSFEPDGPGACVLEDRIEYDLPLGAAGALVGGPFVSRMLERMFAYRHRVTAGDLATHARYPGDPLHVLVSGSTGFVGSALVPFLTTGGHAVTRLVRAAQPPAAGAARWTPDTGAVDSKGLAPLDAVVHLAGENIASGRWSAERKAAILRSRSATTRRLCKTLATFRPRPAVLICASAIGYYGDTGETAVDEKAAPGVGFLADVCRAWEDATAPAVDAGIRVVNLRIGIVLSPAGGVLKQLLTPFQLGLGGRIGSGRQYMSWVALDDLLGIVLYGLRVASVAGPVNAVAPGAVTNAEFTRGLGTVLGRPTLFPIPAAAARLAFGEMAEEMLLASTRVRPGRLTAEGFAFRYPALDGALRHCLGA